MGIYYETNVAILSWEDIMNSAKGLYYDTYPACGYVKTSALGECRFQRLEEHKIKKAF